MIRNYQSNAYKAKGVMHINFEKIDINDMVEYDEKAPQKYIDYVIGNKTTMAKARKEMGSKMKVYKNPDNEDEADTEQSGSEGEKTKSKTKSKNHSKIKPDSNSKTKSKTKSKVKSKIKSKTKSKTKIKRKNKSKHLRKESSNEIYDSTNDVSDESPSDANDNLDGSNENTNIGSFNKPVIDKNSLNNTNNFGRIDNANGLNRSNNISNLGVVSNNNTSNLTRYINNGNGLNRSNNISNINGNNGLNASVLSNSPLPNRSISFGNCVTQISPPTNPFRPNNYSNSSQTTSQKPMYVPHGQVVYFDTLISTTTGLIDIMKRNPCGEEFQKSMLVLRNHVLMRQIKLNDTTAKQYYKLVQKAEAHGSQQKSDNIKWLNYTSKLKGSIKREGTNKISNLAEGSNNYDQQKQRFEQETNHKHKVINGFENNIKKNLRFIYWKSTNEIKFGIRLCFAYGIIGGIRVLQMIFADIIGRGGNEEETAYWLHIMSGFLGGFDILRSCLTSYIKAYTIYFKHVNNEDGENNIQILKKEISSITKELERYDRFEIKRMPLSTIIELLTNLHYKITNYSLFVRYEKTMRKQLAEVSQTPEFTRILSVFTNDCVTPEGFLSLLRYELFEKDNHILSTWNINLVVTGELEEFYTIINPCTILTEQDMKNSNDMDDYIEIIVNKKKCM